MTELFFGFVSTYGLAAIAVCAFLSCLAVPIPTFAIMLAGGAFAASGDLVLWQVILVAFTSAVLGDQTGYQIGRRGGRSLIAVLGRNPQRADIIKRAESTIQAWGGIGVFFSTWLFAPLGPWVNLIAGAAGVTWLRFTVWDAAGEAIWVVGYISLGYLFRARLSELVDIVGDWGGLITSAGLTVLLGVFLASAAVKARKKS
jgi:membrane-associated protein